MSKLVKPPDFAVFMQSEAGLSLLVKYNFTLSIVPCPEFPARGFFMPKNCFDRQKNVAWIVKVAVEIVKDAHRCSNC